MMEARLKPPEYLSLQRNVAGKNGGDGINCSSCICSQSKRTRNLIARRSPSCSALLALERYNHFKWDDSPNDPPNNVCVPDDDNQQSNPQPAQNNAAQANDNRNILRSDVYADVVKRFELEFVGEKRVVFARYRF
ncbi:hypothetical protein NP493_1087g00098 [Ridgeia piscesae]|uniref:Uncharacterized protein n=1 Tax=Ridgeia piscesae TaxID=27915 RepID=A0AAD9NI75_RIDPI|nr:hypothetical protein NP493_1087g00098 [Ridgeia piscesae]